MKSIRLTKDLKQQIVNAADTKLFADKTKELKAKENQLFLTLYEWLYTAEQQEYMAKGNRLYEGLAFTQLDYIRVERRSNSRTVTIAGIAPRPFFHGHHYRYDMIEFRNFPETDVEAEFEKFYYDDQAFGREQNDFRVMLHDLLRTVNTTKQLLEVWPVSAELVPFIFEQEATLNLPSIHLEPLNAMVEKWRNKK